LRSATEFLEIFSRRSSRRSTDPRSARINSSSTIRASRTGSTVVCECGTDASRNARTTCSNASALRYAPHRRVISRRRDPRPCPQTPPCRHALLRLKQRVSLIERASGLGNADVRFGLSVGPGGSWTRVSSSKIVVLPKRGAYQPGAQHEELWMVARALSPLKQWRRNSVSPHPL
jgi:hypothetical protein